MSQEAIEMVRQMDTEKLENQLVLQCAPLIAGIKISNLFIIVNDYLLICIILINTLTVILKMCYYVYE